MILLGLSSNVDEVVACFTSTLKLTTFDCKVSRFVQKNQKKVSGCSR